MRDDAVDILVIDIGGGVGTRQHVFGVEDVEALVLHGTGVEVADRRDHVLVEVEFQAEDVFIPLHRFFQTLHGKAALIKFAGLDVHREPRFASRARHKVILEHLKLRRHHRKKIAGLGKGVFKAHPVAAAFFGAAGGQIAVREQHRILFAVGMYGVGVACHHIGAIEKIRDAAKPLGFALRKKTALRRVETFELGVLLRPDTHSGFQRAVFRHAGDGQMLCIDAVFSAAQWSSIHGDRHQFQFVAIQYQWRLRVGCSGVA